MSAQLETEKKEYEAQVCRPFHLSPKLRSPTDSALQLELVVTSLKDDPDNAELLGLRAELEQMIQLLNDSLAELNPPKTSPPSQPQTKRPTSPPPADDPPKWSRENHPAFKKAVPPPPPPEEEAPASYQVNDNVMAKWLSGDKGFYPARITSVTGSSTAPIYTVRFKSYDTVETLRAKDIRPVASQKRKADGTVVGLAATLAAPVSKAPLPVATVGENNGIVLSAGAELYPQAQQQRANQDKLDDQGKPKYKKIKANKELEAGKNKWQEFNAKGKAGKAVKKDSMFRTPDGVRGRGKPAFDEIEYYAAMVCANNRNSGLHGLRPGHAQRSYEKSSCVSAQRRC